MIIRTSNLKSFVFNIKENITTTPKKLDKPRQITIGFNEAISNFKIKDEVAIATVSDELDLHIDLENEGVHNQSNLNHNCSLCGNKAGNTKFPTGGIRRTSFTEDPEFLLLKFFTGVGEKPNNSSFYSFSHGN